ncbi:phage tail protein [Enterobacter sp.]|uniref:phage tail protein n=1 Tax=Enterobacter sp. TaxID=42895 RepID=UPI003A90F41B
MSAKFYTLLTDIGAAKLASAAALGVPLKITQMAVGDGGGVLPTPNAQQTKLVAEKRRAALNMLYIDPQNSSQIIAEQVIPETEGGWWIREVGLFDETGAMIAVGNCPESYKPQLAEGSGRTQTVRMVLITSSTDNITLKIDPSVVLATRKYVNDKVLELKVYVDDLMAKHLAAADPHTQYATKESPTLTGTPKAPTAPAGTNTTQIASTAFVQDVVTALNNALELKAPLASPSLTGTPTAPTAAQTANNTQIATTAFVKSAIAALVASSPAALDTLNELAEALGNDPNFATTMTNALAGKQPLDATLTSLSGKSISGLLQYLGLSEVLHKGDGRFLTGTYAGDTEDAKSIGSRAATGCQFMRAYKAPDAPDQVNYWQVITMTDVASPTSQVVVLAITTTTNAFAVGYGTGKGITMWRSIPALEGAAFSGNISAPNIAAEFQVKAGEAIFRSDGDIYGSAWGAYGRLSGYLTGTFPKKTEVDEWLSAKPDTTEVAQWLSEKPDRQFITQVGLYQSDKTKPYMLHDDGTGVFLATKDMLSIASLGMTGWHKDNSTGLITQWGEVNTSQAAFRVDFPLAFPNACFGVTVSDRSAFSSVGTTNRTTTGFDLNSSFNGTTNSFYIAKGI